MKIKNHKTLFLAFPLAALALHLSINPQARAEGFVGTNPMNKARSSHTATLLLNGKVLVAGGGGGGGADKTAELFDPASGMWTPTGPLHTPRTGHTATLLPNGNVLVAGGSSRSAELYDPASEAWTVTGTLKTGRVDHMATLLSNGMVLVAGGICVSGGGLCGVLTSAELYDPNTGKWTDTGALSDLRWRQTATLLPNGNVLVAGGSTGGTSISSVELYDPASGTWTYAGSLGEAREGQTATLLADGTLLVTAGFDRTNGAYFPSSAEFYDPAGGFWSEAAAPNAARGLRATATLLRGGNVLVAGGGGNFQALPSAEIFDPAGGAWTETGSMSTSRWFHSATLLPNGDVLVAGGLGKNGDALFSAEIFQPDSPDAAPSLIRNPDETLNLSWRGTGTLEQTESLTTPNWQPAPSQANSQSVTATEASKFYRVKAE
jgi:WD40 repeat protein